MSPSPRKPRVPRVASPPSSQSSSQPPSSRLDLDEVADDLGERRQLGHSAKVTVLRPVNEPETSPANPSGTAGASHEPAPAKERASENRKPKPERNLFPSRRSVALTKAGSPGPGGAAEVVAFPVPRAKRLRRRAVLVAGSVVGLVAGLMAVLVFTPVLAVRTIAVDGTKMLTPAQVQAALAPLVGRPLPQVGPDDVSRLVLPIVQVKSVRTQAVPPNTLHVTVVERVPVALVKQGDAFSVVDGDGVQIATAKDQSAFPVPVIDPQGAHMSHETFLAVTGVLSALPAEVLGQMATASADSVDSVQLKLSNGKTVVWGNSQDRDLKAKVLQALMKNAENSVKGQAPVNIFDVSVPRHPVTR